VVPNPTGDLLGAIRAMGEHRHLITHDSTVERAERAVRLLAANGVTAIRSHVDVTAENGLTSMEALVEVRRRVAGLVDVQLAPLCGFPSLGPAGADQRALYRDALALGADVVGGCPHLEPDAVAANDRFLELAAEFGLPLDLHTDETLDPGVLGLDDLSARVLATGFPHPVTASHCVSLGVQPESVQRRIAEQVAAAGIAVIALPHTNLFLQGRDHQEAMPRGLTAVAALRAAGAVVAAGADNLQDPFNPVGRGDPLETAALMMMTAHLLPDQALASVSSEARRAMGLPPTSDVVRVRAATVREAIAFGPPERQVVRASSGPGHSSHTGNNRSGSSTGAAI
jgi:cytosine/creatinine deaminase